MKRIIKMFFFNEFDNNSLEEMNAAKKSDYLPIYIQFNNWLLLKIV